MEKRAAIALAIVAGLIAVVAPILAALYLADKQSLDEEMARLGTLAAEVLHRSDETSDQAFAAFEQLGAGHGDAPCSARSLERMRAIDLGSTHLQAVGYIAGDKLLCSSLGHHGAGIAVGKPDYLNATGTSVRAAVELPFASGMRFAILSHERSGYAVIIHHDNPLDVLVSGADISIGLVGPRGELIMSRGPFNAEWLRGIGEVRKLGRFDGKNVLVVERSTRYGYAAYAAAPASYLHAGMRRAALVAVPVGLAAGIVLTLAVFYLTRRRLSLPALLRNALRGDEFFLLYQPLVDLQSGHWHGAEALIRWRRPDGEPVRPDLFIPVAEESDLIRHVTRKVMALAARDAAGLLRRHPDFHIGLNLSCADLQSPAIVGELRAMLQKAAIAPGSIMVEATERGFLDADQASQIIRDIRAMGIRVAIDDFGTGYSSLSYLTSFELDYLKIDKSFVDTIGTGAATSQVIPHIIEMAKSLELMMIAEGVETEEQARYLREHGVHYAQGWLFGKPMPMTELARRLEENMGPPAVPERKSVAPRGRAA